MKTLEQCQVLEIADLERIVVSQLLKGISLAEISINMGLSERSVKKLVENANRKMKTAEIRNLTKDLNEYN
ncbi:MAG: hypothetical protein B7Y39_00745 [Bdellovibrio sp. 28-41-41]|nr:MAG: hypothetical protein B7Y39_00745 [Bdellovibrio sp. 28-41-41]